MIKINNLVSRVCLLTNKPWKPGPWDNEPDKANWTDEETKLPCMIVRNESGVLCGYVGVPLDCKIANKDYDDLDVHVHGGLTYASKCYGNICHEADVEVFWFGFDTGHYGDYMPGIDIYDHYHLSDSYYKDFDYVQDQVTNLAKQLKELI